MRPRNAAMDPGETAIFPGTPHDGCRDARRRQRVRCYKPDFSLSFRPRPPNPNLGIPLPHPPHPSLLIPFSRYHSPKPSIISLKSRRAQLLHPTHPLHNLRLPSLVPLRVLPVSTCYPRNPNPSFFISSPQNHPLTTPRYLKLAASSHYNDQYCAVAFPIPCNTTSNRSSCGYSNRCPARY